jgi:hypothetical protein
MKDKQHKIPDLLLFVYLTYNKKKGIRPSWFAGYKGNDHFLWHFIDSNYRITTRKRFTAAS